MVSNKNEDQDGIDQILKVKPFCVIFTENCSKRIGLLIIYSVTLMGNVAVDDLDGSLTVRDCRFENRFSFDGNMALNVDRSSFHNNISIRASNLVQ